MTLLGVQRESCKKKKKTYSLFIFRRFRVKDPRHSETIFAKKRYTLVPLLVSSKELLLLFTKAIPFHRAPLYRTIKTAHLRNNKGGGRVTRVMSRARASDPKPPHPAKRRKQPRESDPSPYYYRVLSENPFPDTPSQQAKSARMEVSRYTVFG